MLIVQKPPADVIRLRFTNSSRSLLGALIRFATMGNVSHVEAVLPDGSIIAALMGKGVVHVPGDYDNSSTSQVFVDIPATNWQVQWWKSYLMSRLGRPYDYETIAGLALHTGWRKPGGLICSMLQALALREAGIFPYPLSEPAHEISPRDLLLMLSSCFPLQRDPQP